VTPHLDPLDRAARRRMLLDHLMENPDDREARRQLTDLVGDRAAAGPRGPGIGLLALVAVSCAILSLVSLLGDMDVTAALLAAAGLYTVVLIRRRRR
jgi:hypothetical protein